MVPNIYTLIAQSTGLTERQVTQTVQLLNENATIPFIARYRKERTGGLDEIQIESIQTKYEKLQETIKRKETIINAIREQGKLTDE